MTLKCDRWPVSYLAGMHNYPIMRSMSKEKVTGSCKGPIGHTTIARLIIGLCINKGKQTEHLSRQVIWIIRLHQQTIQIACLDG